MIGHTTTGVTDIKRAKSLYTDLFLCIRLNSRIAL